METSLFVAPRGVENNFDGGLHLREEHTKRSLIFQPSLIQIIAFLISCDQSSIKQKTKHQK